jgi:hypothetical protein
MVVMKPATLMPTEPLALNRERGWRSRLAAYALEAEREFYAHGLKYGERDCCTLISGAVKAMCGVDPMSEYRGQYHSQMGSLRALQRIGGGDLEHVLRQKFPEVKPGRVMDGDVAMVDGSAGFVLMRHVLVIDDLTERLGAVPIARASLLLGVAHG